MAYTSGDIATRVQQRIKDTGYSSSEIISYINDTQRDVYNEYRLPFMETTQDYTLTVGESDITNGSNLPTDHVQTLDLLLTTTGREKLLPYRDIRSVDTVNPDSTDTTTYPNNTPEYWYDYAQTHRVSPAPDQAYTVTLRYYKRPTALTSTSDVPSLPSEFEELLVVGAAYRVMQAKDNYDQAAIYENKYMELLDKLVDRYTIRQVGQPHIMRINRNALV